MFVLSAAVSSPTWCRCHGRRAGAVISPQLELLELTGLIFLLMLDSCSHPLAASAVVVVHVVMQVHVVVQCLCLGQRTDPDQIQLASLSSPTQKMQLLGAGRGQNWEWFKPVLPQ